ncbi:uncharacterized protein [Ptychodera flava]|uniref:uncharacterized protein n=1 Tax=Ptychodera flava TaxID=63121 RepID=UPI00396A54F3
MLARSKDDSLVTMVIWKTSINGPRRGFNHSHVADLSICQVSIGGFTVTLGILGIVFDITGPTVVTTAAIPCGAFIVVSGVIGLVCAAKKTNQTILTSVIVSIVLAFLLTMLLVRASGALISDFMYSRDFDTIVVDVLLAMVALMGTIAAIGSAVICCKAFIFDQPRIVHNATEKQAIPHNTQHKWEVHP